MKYPTMRFVFDRKKVATKKDSFKLKLPQRGKENGLEQR